MLLGTGWDIGPTLSHIRTYIMFVSSSLRYCTGPPDASETTQTSILSFKPPHSVETLSLGFFSITKPREITKITQVELANTNTYRIQNIRGLFSLDFRL